MAGEGTGTAPFSRRQIGGVGCAVMLIRETVPEDRHALLDLYVRVAKVPGGLARLEPEIDGAYIESFLARSLKSGVSYVAVADAGHVVGEIHAYSLGLYCFSHVLSELTIAVDPDAQGAGVGRGLFEAFMERVQNHTPNISRVELIARESNEKALRFYESLGFEREGIFRNRIRNLDGSLESDIPMAWTRIPSGS